MLAHPQRQLAAEPLIGVFVAKVGNVGFDFASKWVGCGFTRDQRRVRIGGWWMAMNLAAIALARWGPMAAAGPRPSARLSLMPAAHSR
jgi:hypothetical protein